MRGWHRQRRDEFHGQATGVLTADGHFLNASPSLAAFLRTDHGRLLGRCLFQWMDRDAALQVAPRFQDIAHGDGSDRFQVRMVADSMPVWVQIHLAPGGADEAGHPLVVASFEAPRAA